MIKVAVVDDELKEREKLVRFFSKISKNLADEIQTDSYVSGEDLLKEYDLTYDIICLDIQMDGIDGMSAAKKIREKDDKVILIFVTNIAQLAIEGYSVQAMDFIIKPITFSAFALKMQNVLKSINKKAKKKLVLSDGRGWKKISTDELYYAETEGHYISCHTTEGVFHQKVSLKKLEEDLEGLPFKRCNNCYLVNLKHVNSIQKDEALVGQDWLKISRPRKKGFLQALANYMGGIQV